MTYVSVARSIHTHRADRPNHPKSSVQRRLPTIPFILVARRTAQSAPEALEPVGSAPPVAVFGMVVFTAERRTKEIGMRKLRLARTSPVHALRYE